MGVSMVRATQKVGRRQMVLGIFVAKAYAEQFKGDKPIYEAEIYAKAAKHRNVRLYYFTAEDVSGVGGKRGKKKIWGWSLRGNKWRHSRVPWPHVVFDQVIDPEGAEKRTVSRLRRSKNFAWLSPRTGLPKWLTHKILAGHSSLARLLPEERRLKSVDDLDYMLDRHKSVLVKPDLGSRGRGITMIWREPEGTYGLRYSGKEEQVSGLTLAEAYQLASNYAEEDNLVISQQIPLLRVGNSLADMRIIMGKNLQGKWLPVLTIMGVGKEGSFVTNWSMGAEEIPLEQGLAAAGLPAEQVKALIDQVLEVSHKLAKALEAGRGTLLKSGWT